ncbi:MAG TPA: DUF302 domain-containing protein [Trebonia sp.]|nr:DUF302 domain-containing protein [Trebonia sp.]
MTTWTETQVTTKVSPRSVADTVTRLTEILSAKGVKVFSVIDQAKEAREAGLELRETVLVIFGNPAAGTPVMDAVPLAALDLPLKLLVWADGGQTNVSYYSAEALATRYGLSPELAAKLGAVDAIGGALVAP